MAHVLIQPTKMFAWCFSRQERQCRKLCPSKTSCWWWTSVLAVVVELLPALHFSLDKQRTAAGCPPWAGLCCRDSKGLISSFLGPFLAQSERADTDMSATTACLSHVPWLLGIVSTQALARYVPNWSRKLLGSSEVPAWGFPPPF